MCVEKRNFAANIHLTSAYADLRYIMKTRFFLFLLSFASFVLTTSAQSTGIPRVQVIEEATGTWCGWCVHGLVAMNQLEEKYPDTFIGLAVHGDDAYATDSYAPFLQRISGYPYALINRSYSCGTKPSEMLTAYEAFAALGDAEGEAKIVDAHYTDSKYTAVEVTVNTRFAKAHTKEDYRLAFVVVEDSIRDRQTNYYSGGAHGEMGGFEELGENPYVYLRHVVRLIDPYDGILGSVPTQISAGKTYTYTHTITMPKVKMRRRVSIVVLLLRDQGVSIVNASRCPTIEAYVPDGIAAPVVDSAPFDSQSFDLQGRRLPEGATPHGLHIRGGRVVLNP